MTSRELIDMLVEEFTKELVATDFKEKETKSSILIRKKDFLKDLIKLLKEIK